MLRRIFQAMRTRLERLTTVPLWVGGQYPDSRFVVVDGWDDENSDGEPTVILNARSDEAGVVSGRLPLKLRGRKVQIRTFSKWFVHESHPVVIQRFGLIRAMYLRRDFQYTPGGTSENVPPEVLGWDPKEHYLCAERFAQDLARRQVNVIRAAAGSMSLAALALAVGLLPVDRWIVAVAAIGAAGLRMALVPYWDGRRSLRPSGQPAP